MSEKIILTVEQEEQIKSWKKQFGENNEKFLKRHVETKSGSARWNKEFKCLTDLSIDQMARILYEPNSYEVEKPKFEVGDWLVRENGLLTSDGYQWQKGYIFKANFIEESYVRDKKGNGHAFESIRHATKEEIMWAELGREVGEFVEGDVVVFDDDSSCRIEPMYPHTIISIKGKYKKGEVVGFYPNSTFIKLP